MRFQIARHSFPKVEITRRHRNVGASQQRAIGVLVQGTLSDDLWVTTDIRQPE
jgi:hypothetical protein